MRKIRILSVFVLLILIINSSFSKSSCNVSELENLNISEVIYPEQKIEINGIINVPSDYRTIAEAVKMAKKGDLIIISPGQYFESEIEITKELTISSEWKLTGEMSKIQETVIDAGDKILFIINSDGVEISGLKIINGNHTLDINSNVSVIHNHFIKNLDALSFESKGSGYAAYNIIENDRDDGIDLDITGSGNGNFKKEITIEHNTIINSNDDGIEIRLFANPNQNVTYTIRENMIIGSKNAGIQIISYDVYTGKIFHIHHNIFWDCKVGLGCMGGKNTREDLTGTSNMDEQVFFYNNTMVGNQMGATGGNNIIAMNNIVMGNELGGFKRFGINSAIINNLFYNNGNEDFVEINELVKKSGNIFSLDPLVNNNTLEPYANSPCIDAGKKSYLHQDKVLLEIAADYIKGSAPDIGAIESGREYIVPVEINLMVDAGKDIIYKHSDDDLFLKGRVTNFSGMKTNCVWKLEKGNSNIDILHPENIETKVILQQQGIYELSLTCSVNNSNISDNVTIRYIGDGNGKQSILDKSTGNIVKATNYAYYYGNVLVKHDKGISDEIFVMLDNRSKTSCPMLEYFISTSEFADCHIWLMVKKSYSGKNKLKVEFNKEESEDIIIDNKKWKWIKVPVKFKLTAGQWPLYIKNTDGSVCVDKILFSFDPNFSPK